MAKLVSTLRPVVDSATAAADRQDVRPSTLSIITGWVLIGFLIGVAIWMVAGAIKFTPPV